MKNKHMKRLIIIFNLIICLFLISGAIASSQAIAPATATGHVHAEIIPVFSATETAQLNFGRFSPGPQGGLITITPQNTVSVLGTVFKGTSLHNAASFYVSGDLDAAYTISLPTAPVFLKHASNAKTMLIESWSSIPSPGIGAGMLQNGFQVVYVGATLKVGTLMDNPLGIYTGTYTITFDFN
jgi:hypothetical protein